MQSENEYNENIKQRLAEQWAGEKKKIIVALGLLALMGVLWFRVFSESTPENAKASENNRDEPKTTNQTVYEFKQLPVMEGRHDRLCKNFYSIQSWNRFLGKNQNQQLIRQAAKDEKVNDETLLKKLAEKMKLQAIEMGKIPQVFINDELYEVGDKVVVKDGDEKYECEITDIKQQKVFIKCKNLEIKLQFADVLENMKN